MIQKGASTKGTDEICIDGLDGSKKKHSFWHWEMSLDDADLASAI